MHESSLGLHQLLIFASIVVSLQSDLNDFTSVAISVQLQLEHPWSSFTAAAFGSGHLLPYCPNDAGCTIGSARK